MVVKARFRATYQLVETLFFAVTALLGVTGIAVLVVSWPWQVHAGSSGYSDTVATAAGATVFSSLVFSALALPHATATAIAPGYGAEVMTRKSPWITGLALVILSAFLFGLSSFDPDSASAVAAGLLTASGFGATWLVTRVLMTSADPITLSQRQADFIRRSFDRAIQYQRDTASAFVPRKARTPEVLAALNGAQAELALFQGFLRHLRTGVTSSLKAGHPELVGTYWSQMLAMFTHFAVENRGRVGSNMGPVAVLDETLREIVDAGHQHGGEFDRAAQFCVQKVPILLACDVDHPDMAAMRAAVLRTIDACIETVWMNDQSLVPVTLAQVQASCVESLLAIGAYMDAQRFMERLGADAAKAYYGRRTHIALFATEGFVGLLPSVLATKGHVRESLAATFIEGLEQFLPARIAQPLAFQDASELVLPGIGLGNQGIQETISRIDFSPDTLTAIHDVLAPWLRKVTGLFARTEPQNARQDPLQDVLALILWLSLILATRPDVGGPLSKDLALTATAWVSDPDSSMVRERLLHDDTCELIWSILLVCGYASNDPEVVADACAPILGAIGPFAAVRHADEYLVSFLTGLLIASGDYSDLAVQQNLGELPRGPFGFSYSGMHIDGLGRVPSVNRNRIANIPATVTAANEWAVASFDRFVAP